LGRNRDSRKKHPGIVPASAAPSASLRTTSRANDVEAFMPATPTTAVSAVMAPQAETMTQNQTLREITVNISAESHMQSPYETNMTADAKPNCGLDRPMSYSRTGAARARFDLSMKVAQVIRQATGTVRR
jgi:hypothetical protein